LEETHEIPEKENSASHYSLDDYRSKLGEIIRAENEKFRLLAEEQAKEITSEAWRKAEEKISQSQSKAAEIIGISEMKAARIVGDSQQKAEKIIEEHRRKALEEQDEIIRQAKDEAEQVIRQAEENAREEAKNRVKSEREKILAKTQQESNQIITSARQEADQIIAGARNEGNQIIADARDEAEKQARGTVENAKKEAELMIKDEIEKCRIETQTQATQIIKQTEKKAKRLINDIIDDGKQLHALIMNSVGNAENLMVKMKDAMQAEFGELTKQIVETNNKLEKKIDLFVRDNQGEIEGMPVVEIPNTSDDVWLIQKGRKSYSGNSNDGMFIGEIELKTLSSFDMRRIKNVKKLFTQIPSVEYVGEYSSEEGLKIAYNLQEPLQLFDLLKDVPWIDSVVEEGDNLKLTIH
jgi:vacuolar-type H+-ATPase subunit H